MHESATQPDLLEKLAKGRCLQRGRTANRMVGREFQIVERGVGDRNTLVDEIGLPEERPQIHVRPAGARGGPAALVPFTALA